MGLGIIQFEIGCYLVDDAGRRQAEEVGNLDLL